MKLIIIILGALLGTSLYFNLSSPVAVTYYDGEGNVIPDRAVELLVEAQFVAMTKEELDEIRKYFYFYENILIPDGITSDSTHPDILTAYKDSTGSVDLRLLKPGTKEFTLTMTGTPAFNGTHPEIDLISNDTIYVNWYSDKPMKKVTETRVPPLEHRCTEDDIEGNQCRNWSRTDSEYCWEHGYGSN